MPFDQFLEEQDTLIYLESYLEESGGGMDLPAAVILESVQGEGGINAARSEWLQKVEETCRRFDILLIVDDV